MGSISLGHGSKLVVAAWRGEQNRRPDAPSAPEPCWRMRLIWLLFVYVCLATALALLSGSRAGSNINYFIEPLAVASLLVGLVGTEVVRLASRQGRVIAAVVLCAGVVVAGAREAHGELLQWRARSDFAGIVTDLRKIPASAGPMYSTYPELVDDAGRTSYVNDFVQYDGRSSNRRTGDDRAASDMKVPRSKICRRDCRPRAGDQLSNTTTPTTVSSSGGRRRDPDQGAETVCARDPIRSPGNRWRTDRG